jgi:hypothetical protein
MFLRSVPTTDLLFISEAVDAGAAPRRAIVQLGKEVLPPSKSRIFGQLGETFKVIDVRKRLRCSGCCGYGTAQPARVKVEGRDLGNCIASGRSGARLRTNAYPSGPADTVDQLISPRAGP